MQLLWASVDDMLRSVAAAGASSTRDFGGNFITADLGEHDALTIKVLAFRGEESVNDLFRFDVVADIEGLEETGLQSVTLGQAIRLKIRQETGGLRSICGIVAACTVLGSSRGVARYHFKVVPRFWLATKTTDTRVFSDATVKEAVSLILAKHHVVHAWSLARTYERREYMMQYQETDFEFVARLLAEEGIWYSFEHPAHVEPLPERSSSADRPTSPEARSEIMVLADNASSYNPLPGDPKLTFDPTASNAAIADERNVDSFVVCSSIEPTSVTVRDFDHRKAQARPHGLQLATDVEHIEGGAPEGLARNWGPTEHRSFGVVSATHSVAGSNLLKSATSLAHGASTNPQLVPSPSSAMRNEAAARLEYYEHHGNYEQPDTSQQIAVTRLEQLRAMAVRCDATSSCAHVSAGRRFSLRNHELDHLNRGYAVATVHHEAFSGVSAEPSYRNRFTCIPDGLPMRPHLPPKRLHQTVETGVVVGAEGQEIATENLGKVKVQFHWDRRKKHDEHSSCWIRVMQAWAGPGYGLQFVPRVGMEVVVSFVGGDPDRPVVVGCLPNTANQPPHLLPQDKTRSGIRTRSTPGGEGHNELMFEDKAGEEAVYLRAERNFEIAVGQDHLHQIGGNRTTKVKGKQTLTVDGDSQTTIGGTANCTINGDKNETVAGSARVVYQGDRDVFVDADDQQRIVGSRVVTIGGHEQHIVQRSSAGDAGMRNVVVDGSQHIAATESIRVTAGTAMELSVGTSSIIITEDRITMRADEIVIEGRDSILHEGSGARLRLAGSLVATGDTVNVSTEGSVLQMDSSAYLDGATIHLNCGGPEGVAGVNADEPNSGHVRFQVNPMEGLVGPLTFVVATPTGEIVERVGDSNHRVVFEGRPGETFTLLDVRSGDISLGVAAQEGEVEA